MHDRSIGKRWKSRRRWTRTAKKKYETTACALATCSHGCSGHQTLIGSTCPSFRPRGRKHPVTSSSKLEQGQQQQQQQQQQQE
eukprot:9469269-Pyramimonas_sp.AAC.1